MNQHDQTLLAVAAAMAKQTPKHEEYHEGVIVSGSWQASEGTCNVIDLLDD